ncbi:MAG: NAD(P)-binding domain-containing protein [Planctomycetota bacterium]
MEETDIAIIGAGPIGIELAARLKSDGLDYVHVEAGDLGATMGWWAPGTKYFSSPERIQIAGVSLVTPREDKATREQYRDYLRQVVATHELNVRTNTRVVGARKHNDHFILELAPSTHGVGGVEELTGNGTFTPGLNLRAKRVVLAIGNMHQPRRLDIPGEDNPFVSHYMPDPHACYNQKVLIVGGRNSAVEAAIRLYRVGADVHLSYRRNEFSERIKPWLKPELEWLISKGRITFYPETEVTDLRRGLDNPVRAEIRPISGADPEHHGFDRVLLMTGYVQDTELFEWLNVELGDEPECRPRINPKTHESRSQPGVYVAGTACGGSQSRARFFIETCHVHVDKIAAHLQGSIADVEDPVFELEEN